MKLYKKIALACSVVIASSCTLDMREDPNAVQPSQVLPSLILNSMQRNLAVLFSNASANGRALTRQVNAGSSTYFQSITPQGFDGFWSSAYASILEDADQLIKLGKPNGYARHTGIARIIQAYTLVTLVDSFGDVPFSQAFKGDGNFNPGVDDQAALYARAIGMLDSAKLDLTTLTTTSSPPGYQSPIAPDVFDQYYGTGAASGILATTVNAFPKWVKLANTLKLKIYLNTKSAAEIDALIADVSATGGFISNANENFIFRYGTSQADPDARHPLFVGQYPNGGGDYVSNWLVWHMFHGYDATQQAGAPGDPRMRFYFYRQVGVNSTSTNELRCLSESPPSHYPGSTGSAIVDNTIAGRAPLGVGPGHATNDPTDPAWNRTFCVPTDRGYWGRDHVDPQGIPPDGQLRTAYGPYPAGGRFDNNSFTGVTASQGQRGAGFQPIMMRSYVSFMLAEAKLTLTLADPTTARTRFATALSQSFTDVRDWAVNGTYGSSSVAAAAGEAATINAFYPAAGAVSYATDVAAYTASALAAFDASLAGTSDIIGGSLVDETMNYVAREYWIASYGNGVEAFNLYRRTGMPTGMQPVINAVSGPFPRSYWYPASFANLNNTVEQKADLTTRVFWDTNTSNLDF